MQFLGNTKEAKIFFSEIREGVLSRVNQQVLHFDFESASIEVPVLTKTNKHSFLLRFTKNDVPLHTLMGLPHSKHQKAHRDVAQLVAHYVRDVGVGRSSRLIPTTKRRQVSIFTCRLFLFCYALDSSLLTTVPVSRHFQHTPFRPVGSWASRACA